MNPFSYFRSGSTEGAVGPSWHFDVSSTNTTDLYPVVPPQTMTTVSTAKQMSSSTLEIIWGSAIVETGPVTEQEWELCREEAALLGDPDLCNFFHVACSAIQSRTGTPLQGATRGNSGSTKALPYAANKNAAAATGRRVSDSSEGSAAARRPTNPAAPFPEDVLARHTFARPSSRRANGSREGSRTLPLAPAAEVFVASMMPSILPPLPHPRGATARRPNNRLQVFHIPHGKSALRYDSGVFFEEEAVTRRSIEDEEDFDFSVEHIAVCTFVSRLMHARDVAALFHDEFLSRHAAEVQCMVDMELAAREWVVLGLATEVRRTYCDSLRRELVVADRLSPSAALLRGYVRLRENVLRRYFNGWDLEFLKHKRQREHEHEVAVAKESIAAFRAAMATRSEATTHTLAAPPRLAAVAGQKHNTVSSAHHSQSSSLNSSMSGSIPRSRRLR